MRGLGFLAALLATALALMAPARADTVRLRCLDTMGADWAFTMDVDLGGRTIFTVFDSGQPPQTVRANIDDRFIAWTQATPDGRVIGLKLDRATGKLQWSPDRGPDRGRWLSYNECKRLGKPLL